MVRTNKFAEQVCELDLESPRDCGYLQAMMDIAVKAETLGNPDIHEEEAWLLWVVGRLEQVDNFPELDSSECDAHPKGKGVNVRRQIIGRVQFCDVLIEPHGIIPHHSHQNVNGVMRVIEGELTSNNFDLLEQDAEGLLLKPTITTRIKAGKAITLSRYRDNIHEVVAGPEGVRVLDIFTFMEEGGGCRYIDLQDSFRSNNGLFRGGWQDNDGYL